jgi:hypothetical protein
MSKIKTWIATPTPFPNGTPRRLSARATAGLTATLPGVTDATNIEVRCTRTAERKGSGIVWLRQRSQILAGSMTNHSATKAMAQSATTRRLGSRTA